MSRKLVCLGPGGSYGDCVAQWLNANVFHGTVEIEFVKDNQDVLAEIENGSGEADLPMGIVPVYNTVEGYVAGVMRYLMRGPSHEKYYLSTQPSFVSEETFHVVGKVTLRIRHQLFACDPSVQLSDIKTVVSHGQALGQCARMLRRILPDASLEPMSSTSGAAQSVAEIQDPSRAAIASRFCAGLYNLTPLVDDVADVKENYTHFYLVVKGHRIVQNDFGSGVAVLLWPDRNEAGVLHDILSPMAALKVNVRYAPQIPLGGADNRVVFCIEMDVHKNPRVMNAIFTLLAAMSKRMIVLGSFLNEAIIE
ncbi:hypothetical protein HY416_01835 [Candidatus Kaiserbacteria bacterium]|nr:hypothetical protein [Candidatus Kaiserbacteria bacterium]